MGPHGIVVLAPVLDHDLRFNPVPEPFHGQTFIAELAVEAFRRAVLPWIARIDQSAFDPLVFDPFQNPANVTMTSQLAAARF